MAQTNISKTELRIVELLCLLGLSKKEVADKLSKSPRTIETTIWNVYQKLGFSKVQELTLWCVGQKLSISEDIEQLKKAVIACCLLMVFIIGEIHTSHDMTLKNRNRIETRIRRKGN